MLGVNKQNKKTKLQTDLFEILVCKNQENHPFLNIFQSSGNNFTEKKLGRIFGVIQTLDFSENSEYLPNLLAQVIKKEFFRYPKEGAEQCLENALHKANLALADLARHDIVQWIKKLDAVIGVIFDENNILISQAGNGKTFLIRDKNFLEITQSPKMDDEIHPIKTFSEVLSGKITSGDKLIFTTEEVFKFLKREELERHSKVFNPHEFDNLIRSSLELEANNTGMIIANAIEKEIYGYEPSEEKVNSEEKINFFGSQTVKTKKENSSEKKSPVKEPVKEKMEKDSPRSFNSEFYIKETLKEDVNETARSNFGEFSSWLSTIKTKLLPTKILGKTKPKKLLDIVKNSCSSYYQKTISYIKNIDYSKLNKIEIKQKHQEKIKKLLKKSRVIITIVKNRFKIKVILLRKKYRAYKEEKKRKERLDKF